MLKALLFDLDGTLADTDPIHFQTWRDLLYGHNLEINRSFYNSRFSGRMNAAIVGDLLPHLSVAESQTLSNLKEAQFRQRAATQLQPMPGLLNFLSWADAHHLAKAVVTNAPIENVEFMLSVLEVGDRFDTVVLGEALERGKPDPLPYQVALEQLSISAQSAVAFEDSPSGIRSAVAAGILTVGIASTHLPDVLYGVGATLVVHDFADPCLEELLQFSFAQTHPIEPTPIEPTIRLSTY